MPPLKLLGPDWDSQVWQVFRLKNLKAIILTALDPRSKISRKLGRNGLQHSEGFAAQPCWAFGSVDMPKLVRVAKK